MRYLFTGVLIIIIIGILLTCSVSSAALWVESESQGAYIRHPQGWKVTWKDWGVYVDHPQDPMTGVNSSLSSSRMLPDNWPKPL